MWWTCLCSSIVVVSWVKTHVTQNRLHASQLLCTVHELFFMHCMWVIIPVMHDSKKHASNASCAAHESVFLCATCKLTAVFCQRRIKAYNKKAPQQNMIKCVDMRKIIFCQVFTYPYSRWHFYQTNWMPNTIMAQDLGSIDANNLTRLVAQCACMLYHKVQLMDLNWGTGAPVLDCRQQRSLFKIS